VTQDDGTVDDDDLPPFVPSAEAWVKGLARAECNPADRPHMVTALARCHGVGRALGPA
jgi:hypothetical protein